MVERHSCKYCTGVFYFAQTEDFLLLLFISPNLIDAGDSQPSLNADFVLSVRGWEMKRCEDNKKIKVADVLCMNFKNDLSAVINSEVLEMIEHQSSVNPNMPLRLLLYLGRVYEQLINAEAKYKTTLVKIPTPEFFVFYNGKKELPVEQELRLSDAFLKPPGENSVELKVTVININPCKSHTLLDNCRVLKEYSLFIDAVRKHESEESGMREAIKECISKGILAEYLKRKGSEVQNMLIAEYDYETDIRIKQEEARQAGIAQGIEAFVLDNLEEQIPKERIIAKLQKRFDLTSEKAYLYYKKFSHEEKQPE